MAVGWWACRQAGRAIAGGMLWERGGRTGAAGRAPGVGAPPGRVRAERGAAGGGGGGGGGWGGGGFSRVCGGWGVGSGWLGWWSFPSSARVTARNAWASMLIVTCRYQDTHLRTW